jgi:hypothetical protein
MLGFEPVVHAYIGWAVRRRGKLDVETMKQIWPIAVGKVWAERTQPVELRGRHLAVAVPDSVWLSELRFQTNQILARINRLLPEEVAPLESIRLEVSDRLHWSPPSALGLQTVQERRPLSALEEEALGEIEDPWLRELVERVAGMTREKG